jgi:hypothetical protein
LLSRKRTDRRYDDFKQIDPVVSVYCCTNKTVAIHIAAGSRQLAGGKFNEVESGEQSQKPSG